MDDLCGPQAQRMSAYDMWSVGVVWLELLLGTPHVFQVQCIAWQRSASAQPWCRKKNRHTGAKAEKTERNDRDVQHVPRKSECHRMHC